MSSVNPPGRNTDTTKPRQQKETPQQRVRFCDRIRAAYKAFKAGQIMSDAFVSKAGEALDEEYQRLPVVAATKMDPEAVAKAFGLRWDQEPGRFIKEKPTRRGWMMPPNRIQFTHCFNEVMNRLDNILLTSPVNETAIRARVNLLLTEICATIDEHRAPGAKPLHLQMECSFFWEPIDYKGKPYRLDGKPDYSLWYGFEEDTSCNLVIVETKTRHTVSTGQGQTLAYMAIVHKRRKEQHKENCTVYGVCTDFEDFIFYEIDNSGKIHRHTASVGSSGSGYIANVLAEFIYQAALLSPIQSRAHTRENTSESYESAQMPVRPLDPVPSEDEEVAE